MRAAALAAAGLTSIMVGAVVLTAAAGPAAPVMPFVVGVLSAFISYKRWPRRADAILVQQAA